MRQIIDKPSPVTGGRLELCSEPATVLYRGENVSFEKCFYHCVDTGMEFADEELERANLKRMYDTYRRRHGNAKIKAALGIERMPVRAEEGGCNLNCVKQG